MYTKSGTEMPVIKKWVGKNKINAKKHIKYADRTHTISTPYIYLYIIKVGEWGWMEDFSVTF